MTQFTSFVAVEEMIVTDGGQPRRIDVPVEVPEGMNPAAVMESEGTIAQFWVGGRPAARKTVAFSNATVAGAGGSAGKATNIPVSRGVLSTTPAPTPAAAPNAGRGLSSLRPALADRQALANPEPADEVRQKVHRSVFAVVERLRKKEPLTSADEAGFIRNGKAEVQVWLTEKSDEAKAKLKELGFEVVLDAPNSKLIIGRLSIDKLEALAKLKFVKYVAPQVSR